MYCVKYAKKMLGNAAAFPNPQFDNYFFRMECFNNQNLREYNRSLFSNTENFHC